MITLSLSVNLPSNLSFTLSMILCNVSFFLVGLACVLPLGFKSTDFLSKVIAPLNVSFNEAYSSFILSSMSIYSLFSFGKRLIK